MAPSFRIRQAVIIFFIFLLSVICGCVGTGGTGTSLDRHKANYANYRQTHGGYSEKPYLAPIYNSLKDQQYGEAISQAERLKAKYPSDDTLYTLQGYAYLRNDNDTSAVQCFSKAIALNGTKGDVYFFRAIMYKRSGRYKEALEDLNRAIKDKNTPVQLANLDKLEGYTPDVRDHHSRLYYFRADVNKSLGQFTAGLDDINHALKLSAEPNPRHFKIRGDLNYLKHEYALAINDYQRTVALDPTMAGAWCTMGQSDLYLGNYSRAITSLKKAVELDPEYPGALRDLGLAYSLNGEHEKALESMGRELRKNPDALSFYSLAYFHHLNGTQNQALKNYKKARELDPGILETGAALFRIAPDSSLIKRFHQKQLKTAKMYLEAGKTPAAIANENRKPTLEITSVTLEPDPVPVNQAFDFHVKFKADIPGSADNKIATVFYFKVLQNNKILFTSKSYSIKVTNGKTTTRKQHMTPVPAKGVYTIKVFVKYKELLAEKTIKLIIN